MKLPRRIVNLGWLAAPLSLSAPAAEPTPPVESPVQLSAFEVQADSDHSYGALNSNSITQFSAKLDNLPISADILTDTFMKDLGNPTIEQAIMTFAAGAGLGSATTDPGSGAATVQPLDRTQGVELRGMGGTSIQRDGFAANNSTGSGITSNFAIERIEVINGPESLLYGTGGAGGVINLISKQARFGRPLFGSLQLQIDQYGNKMGQLDFGVGRKDVAIRAVVLNQTIGNRRTNIGGPIEGYYLQGAVRLFGNTTVRLNAEQSKFSRLVPDNLALNTGSTANDGRNGQFLNFLIATNQLNASATGASGAGVIANQKTNWDNVESYGGQMFSEKTVAELTEFSTDTRWNSWFSTRLSASYRHTYNDYVNNSITFFSPNNPANPLGTWAMGLAGATPYLDTEQSSRAMSVRLSALATNDFFHGRAHSQSMFGLDGNRGLTTSIAYSYFLADANFNPVISSAVAANNGRTLIPKIYWSVDNGPVKYPLWTPAINHLTYNGANYVRMIQNPVNPALISPANPNGVTLGGANYSRTPSIDRGAYFVNYTQWLDGRLDTLAGFRYFNSFRRVANNAPVISTKAHDFSYDWGADYHATKWLHPYLRVSNSFNFPGTAANDVYGTPPPVSQAIGEEIGVKSSNSDGTFSGSLAIYHVTSKNEQYLTTATLLTDINPAGLNGRLGSPAQWIFVDRASRGVQASLTAAPASNWRIRFSAAYVKGIISTTTSFAQLYNDQFYANAQGQVTYADGSAVYVNPTFVAKTPVATATTPGAIPLTIAQMNTASSPYYANPVAVTGQISPSSNVATVLKTVDPVHGAILTGAVGLPISKIQINPGFTPSGSFLTSQAGDLTMGYPNFSLNLTNVYTVPAGRFKGAKIGGTVLAGWRRNDYYYYTAPAGPGVPRALFTLPTLFRVDPIIGYEKKFDRVTWSTQLNIVNVFNRYKVILLPSATAGWGGINNATFDQQPRTYLWTNTLAF